MTKCLWIGNGEGCSHSIVSGKHYCETHLWQVYQKGSAHARRKKDIRVADSVHTWESLFHEAVGELEAEGFDFEQPIVESSLVVEVDEE
jgi:hypothetical protein